MVRECLLINLTDGTLVRLEPSQRLAIDKFLPFVTLQNADAFISTLNEGIFHLERNAHAKILFLDLSMKINKVLQQK
jgi:DNA polymerase-3 subunit delta'